MKKRKNGFTLVELLAVIVILAIILIIAVPGVLSIINQTKNSAYESQLKIIKEAAKNYIMAERSSIVWEGTDPAVTVVSLAHMQQSGYLENKVMDPRDKSIMKNLAVKVSKASSNQISYDVIETTTDEIEIPRIGSGMIPIVYDGTNWVKADASNKNFAWYDYDNHQWANIATVTDDVRQTLLDAPIGTEVPMDKINAMFTWIPRFKYKLFNVDGTISPVGNANLTEDYMIDIKFENKSTSKSKGSQNGEWLTHPAFTFGEQELDGFWMAKFETGYAGATSPATGESNTLNPFKIIIKPNVYSWRSIQVVNMFKNARGMSETNNPYGFTTNEDPHLAKNMEWGALTYLTYSIYGKAGNSNYSGPEKEVRINNNNIYLTGCGASTFNAEGVGTCNTYDTVNGQAASTTGNITGVYDTSGGAWDYVAGVMKMENGTDLYVSSSGFDQAELNQLGAERKYLDVYEYGTNRADRSRGHLGDATKEMGPFNGDRSAWYEDFARFPSSEEARGWIARSNNGRNQSVAGIVSYANGFASGDSAEGSRVVIL